MGLGACDFGGAAVCPITGPMSVSIDNKTTNCLMKVSLSHEFRVVDILRWHRNRIERYRLAGVQCRWQDLLAAEGNLNLRGSRVSSTAIADYKAEGILPGSQIQVCLERNALLHEGL